MAQTCNVVVDFTAASQGVQNTKTIIEAGARAVIGTSGFMPEDITALTQLCEQHRLGAIIAPNFSIGAVLMMHFAALAAQHHPAVEIIELHHDKKQEAPSGTALKTADMIAATRGDHTLNKGEELIAGARGGAHHNIPIHSIRLPGLIAHQAVMFGGTGESLTIRHDTMSREAFMPGVLLACERVMQIDHLLYGLEHLIIQ